MWEHETVVIQARLVFGSGFIIQIWSDLSHITHANWERLSWLRQKSFVIAMSQTSLLSEISLCIPSCSVERGNCSKTLHNSFATQVVASWSGVTKRVKLDSLILSSNYLKRWYRWQQSTVSVSWKTVGDKTLSVTLLVDTMRLLTSACKVMMIPVTKKLSTSSLSLRNPCWLYLGTELILIIDNRVQKCYFYFWPQYEGKYQFMNNNGYF